MATDMEKYVIPDFCFVRTPAYPVNLLNQLYLKHDTSKESISSELKKIFSDESIQQALHASSSREFNAEFRKWLEGNKTLKESEKIEETLVRYLERMTTRCTPFGMFSGFSVAELAGQTNLQLDHHEKNISHMRLDMEYMQDIIYKLCSDERIRQNVKYFSNSSIYRIGNKFKYVEYTTDTYVRHYCYAAVNYEEYVDRILQVAATGCTYAQLRDILKEYDEELSDEDANEFISQLITAQVLVSELEPNITGKDNLDQLIETISALNIDEPYSVALKKIQSLLSSKQYEMEKLQPIRQLVEEIVGPKPYWSTLQTDLEIALKEKEMNSKVMQTILDQVQNLSAFAYGIDRPALRIFRQEFVARYDTQEIPMVEALDPDMGVGYGQLGSNANNTLLKDIYFGQSFNEPIPVNYDAMTDFVTNKYIQSVNNGLQTIMLTDAELKQLKEKGVERDLPENFFIHGPVVAASAEELDKGNFIFQLKHISGPPSCPTLGRFAYASDFLHKKIIECIDLEERLHPDAIHAEIVHLTDARAGNVIIRPCFRKYEISYLGKSGLDTEYQIPITDIMVSVKNNTIKLRSKKLNKEILPRLTNAHVFTDSYLPIYKFLGDVQRHHGSDWLSWHWQYLKDQKFLPRVQYKNIVLKTAKWLITKEDLSQGKPAAIIDEVAKKFCIPRFVSFFEQQDKEFVFDLQSEISCGFIVKEINKNGKILLEEYLQSQDNCWLTDVQSNRYANEIMLPINKVVIPKDTAAPKPVTQSLPVARKFAPGSEWIYLKLYTSQTYAETILIDHLYDFVAQQELISSWHYLRYADPEYHLRIRFRVNGSWLQLMEKIAAMTTVLQEQKLVYKVQFDTYDREVERYGAHTMEEAEKVFQIDSQACLAYSKLTENYNELHERWLWALKALDMLLDSFGLTVREKLQLMSEAEKFEMTRNNGTKLTLKQANAKYKKFEKEIKNLLAEYTDRSQLTELLQEALAILDERKVQLDELAPALREKVNRYGETDLNYLAGTFIHMFVNRLFVSNPNKCELVLYTLLNRYYLVLINTKVTQA